MAGKSKEPGPSARRVAENVRLLRHARKDTVTTAELSRRLTALGQPIPDTGITKTEQGTRRVDVDDLVALAVALGVTPNTLLLPDVDYVGGTDFHDLTPAVNGTAGHLWEWAQGETPLHMHVPGSREWLGNEDHPALRFSIRTRPYLTALHPPGTAASARPAGTRDKMLDLAHAALDVLADGATPAEVRRTVEMAIALPVVMPADQIRDQLAAALDDGKGK
jgi:transcriptional regulator with XRE-family HTH domain